MKRKRKTEEGKAVVLQNTLSSFEVCDVIDLLDRLSVMYVSNTKVHKLKPVRRQCDMLLLNLIRKDLYEQ